MVDFPASHVGLRGCTSTKFNSESPWKMVVQRQAFPLGKKVSFQALYLLVLGRVVKRKTQLSPNQEKIPWVVPLPRFSVSTKDYRYYSTFWVGDPDLNLHLPLFARKGGNPIQQTHVQQAISMNTFFWGNKKTPRPPQLQKVSPCFQASPRWASCARLWGLLLRFDLLPPKKRGKTRWVEHIPPGIFDEFSKTPTRTFPGNQDISHRKELAIKFYEEKNRCESHFF